MGVLGDIIVLLFSAGYTAICGVATYFWYQEVKVFPRKDYWDYAVWGWLFVIGSSLGVICCVIHIMKLVGRLG